MPSSGVQTCALRSEEHTSELLSHDNLVCRLLLEKEDYRPRPEDGLIGSLVALVEGGAAAHGLTGRRLTLLAGGVTARCGADWLVLTLFLKVRPPRGLSPFPLHPAFRY